MLDVPRAVRHKAGRAAVLKIVVPRDDDSVRHEIATLLHADGDGCARLLRHDTRRGALLLERLGPSLHELGLPARERQQILGGLAARVWRPAAGLGLPTGADKGRWLIEYVTSAWRSSSRSLPEEVVAHAVACAERRIAAHADAEARLVHGDVHEWNALRSGAGFALVDPDGLFAEPAYDLGVLMREDPVELLVDGSRERARRLATQAGCDATAVWEWGVVERVSTGLLLDSVGVQPVAAEMLTAACEVGLNGR